MTLEKYEQMPKNTIDIRPVGSGGKLGWWEVVGSGGWGVGLTQLTKNKGKQSVS